jgi:hypothetical protein
MMTKERLINVTCGMMLGLVITAAIVVQDNAAATITPISYGDAASFSILAGTGITNGGPDGGIATLIGNNVGLSPATGANISGLTASQVGGTIYTVNTFGPAGSVANAGLLTSAKNDFGAAFTAAAGQTPTAPALGLQLGGQTVIPGVYTFVPGTVLLSGSGTLRLDANGVADPVWIFQATSGLTTAANSSVVFVDGGTPCDVIWQVPTQATLGANSDFAGTIMAGTAIVMGSGATLDGRAWAEAEVTLLDNTITGLPCTILGGAVSGGGSVPGGGASVPESGNTLLLVGSGLAALLGLGRRILILA